MNDHTAMTLDTMFNIDATNTTSVSVIPEIVSEIAPSAPELTETEDERQAREDLVFSRGAIKAVAVEAQNTLHRAVEVAEQVDSPRSFEAVAQMIRATLDTHKELHALHKTAAEIRATKIGPTTVNVDKGVVFTGGADELLKLIDPSRQ